MSGNESIDLLRKDHTQLASNVSAVMVEMGAMRTERAVEAERDKYLRERLERIEKRLDSLFDIGKWALLAFFGSLIAALVTFIVKGGFNVPPPTP